jgi:drug/metabolite transporter (DMT)-like permease
MAMQNRSFVVAIAYIKTEPVLVAIFGLAFLGDALTSPVAAAILIATAGVVAMSWTPGIAAANSAKPAALGIVAGVFFALAAVSFRGAVLSLPQGSEQYLVSAAYTLVWSMAIQTMLLSLWLAIADRKSFFAIFRVWKPSLSAGFMGALASQFWFMAFALATAASVRTLALIEVLFAQIVTQRLSQKTTRREAFGILLLVAGIALLLWAHP